MRWRVAAPIALFGIALIPGVSGAAELAGTPTLHVSVTPGSGSRTTHFVVSFKAALATELIGPDRGTYRVTASDRGQGQCQASVAAPAPPSRAGAIVRVKLAPAVHRTWCPGMFRGQVWKTVIPPCPIGTACPAILPLPQIVGRFSFRVRRG